MLLWLKRDLKLNPLTAEAFFTATFSNTMKRKSAVKNWLSRKQVHAGPDHGGLGPEALFHFGAPTEVGVGGGFGGCARPGPDYGGGGLSYDAKRRTRVREAHEPNRLGGLGRAQAPTAPPETKILRY